MNSEKITESALRASLVDFPTTNAHLFEGMLCSYKVFHSVPTNSSRCLVNRGAIERLLQPAEVPTSASIYVALGATVSDCGKTRFSKQQNQFLKQILHLNQEKNINRTMLMTWWSIPSESTLKNISDGSSLLTLPSCICIALSGFCFAPFMWHIQRSRQGQGRKQFPHESVF